MVDKFLYSTKRIGDLSSLHNAKKTLLLGAGASNSFGIPTMKEFLQDFNIYLNEYGSYDENAFYKMLLKILRIFIEISTSNP